MAASVDELNDAELEQHIHDTGLLLQRAYARFQAHGLPADRDEALTWWAAEREALHARSARLGACRHSEFERRLADTAGVRWIGRTHD